MPNDMLLRVYVRATMLKQQVQRQGVKAITAFAAANPVMAFADGDDLAGMITSASEGAKTGTTGVLQIAQFVGLLFVVGGLMAAKAKKDNPQIKVSHIAGSILIGACMIVIPEIIKRSQRQVGLTPVNIG